MVKLLINNLILILIIVVALVLRMYRLDYLELFGDEIDAAYQSFSILETGRDYKGHLLPAYMQSFSEWRAPGLMYAMLPFIKLFGMNEYGVRLGPAIFGVLSIIAFYLLMGELGVSKKVRLATALIISILPWHIQYSRAGFEVTLLSFLLITASFLLVGGIRKQKNIWIIMAGILFSMSIYTYNTANIYVPLFALLSLLYFRANKRQILILLAVGVMMCMPIAKEILWGHAADRFGTLSLIKNKEVVAEVNEYRNKAGNTLLSKVLYNKPIVAAKRMAFNYTNAFSSDFLFRMGDVTFRHSLHQVGNLYWVLLPLIIIGFVGSNKYLLTMLLLSPIPATLTIDGYNHATRLFMMIFPLAYLAAFGFSKLKLKSVGILALVLLSIEFVNYQNYYWTYYRLESWRWWHTGYKQALTYINNNKEKYGQIMIENTYEPSLIRYLFWAKVNPENIFNLDDKMTRDIDEMKGFCIDEKICFVDYGDRLAFELFRENSLYLISHEKNIGGENSITDESVEVLETIKGPDNKAIFYLLKKRSPGV